MLPVVGLSGLSAWLCNQAEQDVVA